jgi:anti-anti-sigma factor
MTDSGLAIQVVEIDTRHVVVAVTGVMDFESCTPLDAVLSGLVTEGRAAVVLDLTAVPRLDSSGLGLLVRFHHLSLARDGWLRLVGVNPAIRRSLEITNLDSILGIYATIDAALADDRPPTSQDN